MFPPSRTDENHGDIRLVGDTMNGHGAVEIYDQSFGRFLTICPDSSIWTEETATAACVQLGYESGTPMPYTLVLPYCHVIPAHVC